MTISEQSDVLGLLRRYQQVLIMGGGVAITVVVLAAGLVDVVASVNAYLARMKEEVSMDVRKALAFNARTVSTLRYSVQSMELAWSGAVAGAQDDDTSIGRDGVLQVRAGTDGSPLLVLRNTGRSDSPEAAQYVRLARRMAATTAVIASRNEGDLTVYLFSPDRQYLVMAVLPWRGGAWQSQVTSNRAGLFDTLTSSNGAPITPPQGGWRVFGTSIPKFQWLNPYRSPLTGREVERIATELFAENGARIGTLVYELPLSSLAANLPETSFAGTCLVLAPDGSLVMACPATHADELLPLARKALADGLGHTVQTIFRDGNVLSGWALTPTGQTLVHAQSWREVAAGVRLQVILAAITSATIIALTWALLLMVKWRVFAPAVQQSQRVLDSEQLSRKLVDTAPVGLGLITVHSGQPLLRSPTMIVTADRIIATGLSLSGVFARHYQQREALLTSAERPGEPPCARDTEVIKDELTFRTRSGQRLDLAVSMVRARYLDQDVLVTAFTDITADKQLERELRSAQLAADAASAAKSAFLTAMSHEIRTPLNAVLGNLELLAYSPLDERQRDRLNTIRNASDGLLTVVSDVLDFSKIEAGELQLEELEFDVLELASDTLMVFSPIAEAKGLPLAAEFGETVSLPLRADPTRLRQVMNNLMSNAIKFTERGRVTFRLSCDRVASQVLIEVEDTGIGMSAHQVSRLFQDFSQADATISRRFGGTGLGLALSYRLVQAMGGELTVRSELGAGSSFILHLPVSAGTPVGQTPSFEGQSIQIVAASDTWRSRLRHTLNSWGLQVTCCSHPALITRDEVDDADVLVFWGERRTWHFDDERRLVEHASWVVDCAKDGPAQPVINGRVISANVHGLQGLANSLRYALQGTPLSKLTPEGMILGNRLRVLLAEDNVVNRKLLEEQLALLGCVATVAKDAQQALVALEKERFDVLLTDLSMPGQDGFALTREVRERWPAMPVMAVTANVTPQQREQGERVGMARVLGKPLSLVQLRDALCDVASLAPLRSEAFSDCSLLEGRPIARDTKELFIQSCLDSLQALHLGLRDDDAPSLLAELHSLGGACGVFGLNDIAERCACLTGSISTRGVRSNADGVLMLCYELVGVLKQHRSV
ncbi:ATP-binding protein [Achromobacter sp. JUb104]|uniref:hybrid sensor histidine kinase/response regulator n=1 Tax=Achromobacter sp. JUb104 TaxID=2940590 RepID=UPI0021699008|nr:ATP-binding protein [Achromobacter sp. JUb104]MCS3509248.1 two-component system capsular synthesis sensor histidine kinase RcsC [Achromobacter sp. JUb104]